MIIWLMAIWVIGRDTFFLSLVICFLFRVFSSWPRLNEDSYRLALYWPSSRVGYISDQLLALLKERTMFYTVTVQTTSTSNKTVKPPTNLKVTECPKMYRKSVLHLLKYRFVVNLSRCDIRILDEINRISGSSPPETPYSDPDPSSIIELQSSFFQYHKI